MNSLEDYDTHELMRELLKRSGSKMPFDFQQLQNEVREWSDRNFGSETPLNSVKNVLGIIEEAGELAEADPSAAPLMIALGRLSHSHLKELQGIRGTAEEHQAKAKDAVGDILVYAADYCGSRGWSLQEIVEAVWGRVKQRDWTKNKLHGGDTESHYDLHPELYDSHAVRKDEEHATFVMPMSRSSVTAIDDMMHAMTHGMVRFEAGTDVELEDQSAGPSDRYFLTPLGADKLVRHGIALDGAGVPVDLTKPQAADDQNEARAAEDIPF